MIMVEGKTSCNVCHKEFDLIAEKRYTARSDAKIGLSAVAGGDEPNLHDAVDCPHCGCQKLLQVRLRPLKEEIEEEMVDE